MTEHRLIKKIKEFRQIKPDQEWADLIKSQILGQGKEIKTENWLFIPIRKPALVVAPLVVLAAVLGGVFVYFNFLPQAQTPIVSKIVSKVPEKQIVVSLEELQASLEKITLSLDNLKKAKDPNQALVMAEIIKATAKNGEEIVGQIKSLASLGDAYRELGEKASNTQIERMGNYIEDLSQGSLSEEDEARLQKAIKYYNEGEIEQAIILIQRIGNK